MYAEISKEAFEVLTQNATYGQKGIENTELARKYYYNVYGVQLLRIYNHVAQVSQYYIQDINS